MPELTHKPQVTYRARESLPGQGARHRLVEVVVERPQGPVELDIGQLGVSRLILLSPQPLSTEFIVAWDGDTEHPKLDFRFSHGVSYPSQLKLICEVYGK